MRIVAGLSGGVDSAVAAYILRTRGHDVTGVTLRTWESGTSRCCGIDAARETADYLGLRYHVLNCFQDFKRLVEEPFSECYLKGLTPNPCVLCNSVIKWKWLLYAAALFGADAVATGHYASVVRRDDGTMAVGVPADKAKDQSYMLYRLTREQLSKTVFPLENMTKEEVRRTAFQAGLPAADSPESQDVCFVTNGRYSDYIESKKGGAALREGRILNERGETVGTHRGIAGYTVGQRKGLGLDLGHPVYVKSIRYETNEIVVSDARGLMTGEISCSDLCFSGLSFRDVSGGIRATVRMRSHGKGAEGTLYMTGKNCIRVVFDEEVRSPSPGQSAVFYDKNGSVTGGGVITGCK